MVKQHLNYIDEKTVKRLKKSLKAYYSNISANERFNQNHFTGNAQWMFFSPYYEKYARDTCREIAEWLVNKFPEVKKTISPSEIEHFLQYTIFYRLTFRTMKMLIPVEEEKTGKKKTTTVEPRNINIASAIANEDEMETLVTFFDEKIAEMVHFYKSHRSLAVIEVANIKIEDTETDWEFCNINFVSRKGTSIEAHFKWALDSAKPSDINLNSKFQNLALIKFEGSSSQRAFALSIDYFNKAFAILRVLGSRELNRQCWTSKAELEIPVKSPEYISSSDDRMLSAINPNIDNDFFVAIKENSIYLPIVLNKQNIQTLESSEFMDPVRKLLKRSFEEKAHQIDEKIFDSISWFSESQKNTNAPHKIIVFIIALETLLSDSRMADGTSDKSISELFSDRGAIILHEDYENRLKTKKKLKKIYGLRSAIVHGSKREVAKSANEELNTVFEIEHITAEIILKTIDLADREKLQSIPELNTYVQQKLLS